MQVISVYSYHLFLISSALSSSVQFNSVAQLCPTLCDPMNRSTPGLPLHQQLLHKISVLYCAHLCVKCSLDISNLLEELSSLSHSIVFLYFFALTTVEGFLSLLAILWNSAFKWVYLSFSPLPLASILFSVICKASSDNHFAFFPHAPVSHKSPYLPTAFLLHALVHFFPFC